LRAKRSNPAFTLVLDCFASLAMTGRCAATRGVVLR